MRLPFLLLITSLIAYPQKLVVKKHTLANGMSMIIHEDHDIPNVALYLFFKVGSRNERPGITGLSHFFEHMMFNGAKKYGPKQFDFAMENAGGNNNAYTSHDLTVYQDWFPRTALPLIFELEADRLRDLAFDPKIVESERGVVYSERRTAIDNNPPGALNEQMMAAAYTAHPYHWPVVGWPSDIEGWTMSDLKQYWSLGYAPNNCILVVAGDVTEAEVLGLAKKHLEPIARRNAPPLLKTKEPQQQGERRVVLEKPAQLPLLLMAFHTVESKHPDTHVITVLDSILTDGRSSRLYRRLVEQDRLALDAGAQSLQAIDPALWIVQVQPSAGVDPAKAESAVNQELERLGKELVTAAELETAKNQILAKFYRDMKTIAGKANFIGNFEIYQGDAGKIAEYPASINRVTAADIQRVAAKYLNQRNRTVATLIPTKEETAQ
jgi:zinc protease